ncbi:MAG TPA: hypothetical protein VJB96_02635, partial [Patescibacteria group bacterium]|nr:hypothetical protein [Patescibacteria group bacterium]
MNPSLEPLVFISFLALLTSFLILIPKRLTIPKKIPSAVWLFIVVAVVIFEYILFTTPIVQKQLLDFGVATVVISPLTIAGALAFLSALMVLQIPKWVMLALIIPITFYVGELAYYDATHIIGPVHDLLMGKLPLSSPSWYGLLPIVGLSIVFRIVPLT